MDNHPPRIKPRPRPAEAPRMKSSQCGAAPVIALPVLLLAAFATAARAAPVRVADFGFELDDTSLQGSMQGPQPEEQARLGRLDAQLRDLLAKAGYEPVDTAPVTAEARQQTLRTCDGCEVALARKLGAQVSVIGWVQKVSNLILNINLVMRDVATGKVLRAGSVDIRGDNDVSWSRGLTYLMRESILPANKPRNALPAAEAAPK